MTKPKTSAAMFSGDPLAAVVADLKIAEFQDEFQEPTFFSSLPKSTDGTAAENSVAIESGAGVNNGHRNNLGPPAFVSSGNKGTKTKSRIDKWKKKHAAVLVMSENDEQMDHDEEEVGINVLQLIYI